MKKFKKIIALAMAFTACLTVNTAVMCTSIPTAALSLIDYIVDAKLDKEVISQGEKAQIELVWSGYSSPEYQNVFFRSDNEEVAEVDQNGVITGISPGTATITISPSNYGTDKHVEIQVVIDDIEEFMPDRYYEIKDGSIYFHNWSGNGGVPIYTVNINSDVDYDMEINGLDGVFTPKEDNGVYILSIKQIIEDIVSEGNNHFHYFYPIIEFYTVKVSDGEITTDIDEFISMNWYSKEQIDNVKEQIKNEETSCFDVYAEDFSESVYYSIINGMMPPSDNYGYNYISTVYYSGDYKKSYFCMRMPYNNDPSIVPEVRISDKSIAEVEDVLHPSSDISADDIMNLYRVKALKDGNVSVNECELWVKDGVFRYSDADETGNIIYGDVNGNGVFNVSDIVMLHKYLSGKITLNETEFNCADMNGDHTVNIFDAIAMKRKLLEKRISYEMSEIPLTDELREIAENGDDYVITSTGELNAFFDSVYSNYYIDNIPVDMPDEYSKTVYEYNQKYNKAFFEKNVLLLKPFVKSVYGEYELRGVSNEEDAIKIWYIYEHIFTGDPVIGDDSCVLGQVAVPKSEFKSKTVSWKQLLVEPLEP